MFLQIGQESLDGHAGQTKKWCRKHRRTFCTTKVSIYILVIYYIFI
jgi:hypothetical protein